jgi:hypothetical protein
LAERVGDGSTGVALTVKNDMDGPIGVTVQVDTTPAAAPK